MYLTTASKAGRGESSILEKYCRQRYAITLEPVFFFGRPFQNSNSNFKISAITFLT